MFENPEHVSVCSTGEIFVTDYLKYSTITCLTDDGKIHFKFDDASLLLEGLYADDNGDLIVCNRHKSTIIIITDSGTLYRTLLSSRDSINKPHCVTYRPRDGTLVKLVVPTAIFCWYIQHHKLENTLTRICSGCKNVNFQQKKW